MLTARPGTTLDDLRAAGRVMTRAWLDGAPYVAATPAATEWWHASSAPDPLGAHLRLWSEDGVDVAWSWHDAGEIEWHVWTGDRQRDPDVFRAILEAAIEEAGNRSVGTWSAADDAESIRVLEGLGFVPAEKRLSQFQWRPTAAGAGRRPAAVPLPPGYHNRPLAGPGEIPARVEVHRAAFAPSKLTVEKYERLQTMPHYRLDDDLVVEAPGGGFAAFAMAWWDGDARVGEFEPVGTHPEYQRRGLSRALLTWGLCRYADRGAKLVQVYSDASTAASEALYQAVGFERRAFHRRYERPAGPGPDLQSGP
jgi:ribosomal protein S18 acetylase RimI-like enzyme